MTYFDEEFAKVYDYEGNDSIVVLEWGQTFIWLESGKDAVNAVLETCKSNSKTKLLALIKSEGFNNIFLEWLVEDWYPQAYAAGLTRIAHKMGEDFYAQLSAEQVSGEDKSGIVFKNFYEESDAEILLWLNAE